MRRVFMIASVIAYVFVLAFALRVNAQIDDDSELALALAKVSANEASLTRIRPAEVALIWQVTERRGRSSSERLRWLRAHSSCVLTDRPLRESERGTNCEWSRNLQASDDQPEGWPAAIPWSRYTRRWQQVRGFAQRLVDGREQMRPCPGSPITWGGARIDLARALARGLRPLGCRNPNTGEPTLNDGFVIANRAS